ncbi:MAG: response regulator [Bacteroidetes bacterium]|nr:response regulator [Bacteroidota bacterium]
MTILLLDDENLELFITKTILEREFQVHGFNTLDEAVAWARNNPFDVLISDYYLDRGMTAQNALKALEEIKGKNFKSVVLTNYSDHKRVAEIMAAGFTGVVDKPLELAELKKIIGL